MLLQNIYDKSQISNIGPLISKNKIVVLPQILRQYEYS